MANSQDQLTSSGETHTTALTFLVIFVGLVLAVAFGGIDLDNRTNANQADPNQPDTQAAVSNSAPEDQSVDMDLPAGIPVDGDAVVENRMITRGGTEAMEQVITFDSSLSTQELIREYQAWLNENNYTIQKERIGQKAGSLAAINGSQAVIVLISYLNQSDTARVEIINYRRS